MTTAAGDRDVVVGIDVGGTFTDVVCAVAGEPQRIFKIPSTRDDPSVAILQSLKYLKEHSGIGPDRIGRFIHGTTIATNAVLERDGAKIGLLTTHGFRDVLEIGRVIRKAMYHVILKPETPGFLAPGALRKEAVERVTAEGKVHIPLDEESVISAVDSLVADGVHGIAICFLFSFLNPVHERRAQEIIRSRYPGLAISLSSDVDPAFREYERTLVTAFDAYVKPRVDGYLKRLESGLATNGVTAPLQVMQSRGGLAAAEVARQRPVRLFLSGPAAGVIGGRVAGEMSGETELMTVDIGGTSCDIALVSRGKPMVRAEGIIGGYPVRVPMVDVNTIGSGGGSIAWIDEAGALKVGPRSAGSEPGPACYGRGGQEATVTDASVVLGYLNPEYFAGGALKLLPKLAYDVIEQKIARPLGIAVEEAALGIHRVLNAQMTEGMRLVSIRQGLDPRNASLIPLGGAGPVHATALARNIGIKKIIVPRNPGVLAAAGLLAAPIEHEVSMAFPRKLSGLNVADVRSALKDLDKQCSSLMALERVATDDIQIRYSAELCYVGQSYYLEVPLDTTDPDPLVKLYRDFLSTHDRVYGYATEAPARIMNLRTSHQALGGGSIGDALFSAGTGEARKSCRRIWLLGEVGPVDAIVYDRLNMKPGVVFQGPAIVEQLDTTTVIESGWQVKVDDSGNMIVNLKPGAIAHQEQGAKLDPITVEVVRHRLEGIANEMEATLFRSAFSTLIKEALDASASLFTIEGETLAQAIAIPNHLTTLVPMVGKILEAFPVSAMSEGDAYTLNDPYWGGTHMPDIAVIMPVFWQGKPVALSATLAHHQDVGGMTPGSIPTNATDIFQEGFRIPPMKLRDKGVMNETLLQLLRLNVRLPDTLMGDLNAQIAACIIGERRIRDLAEIHGADRLLAIFKTLLDHSELLTRQSLRRLPAGTYTYSDIVDNDGVDLDRRIAIKTQVTVADGTVQVDFAGTSSQARGPFNCVPSSSYAAACFAVLAIAGSDVPANGGCFRPLRLNLPEGSVLNPRMPGPVGCRVATAKRVTGCILGAFRQAAPDRVPADSASELCVLVFGGRRRDGSDYISAQLLVSGSGAGPATDGVDVIETDLTNSMNVPTEFLESEVPIRVNYFGLAADSGGPGRFRGGLGCVHEFEVLDGDITFTYRGERHYSHAAGADGGLGGGSADAIIHRRGGSEEGICSKIVTTLRAGDRVWIRTAGGGGHGDPLQRDRAALLGDVMNGKVSAEAAKAFYGAG
jgi:N-methylhydantoinase A